MPFQLTTPGEDEERVAISDALHSGVHVYLWCSHYGCVCVANRQQCADVNHIIVAQNARTRSRSEMIK